MTTGPGATRLEVEEDRKKRPAWLWLLMGLLGLAALLLLLSQLGGNDARETTGLASPSSTATANDTASAPSQTATTTATATGSTSATATDAAAAGGAAGGGALTADGTALLPLASAAAADGSLVKYQDTAADGKSVRVESVPADEGFWVGTSETDRVYVQLTGTSESGFTVKPGDIVTFTGQVAANAADFPAKAGVDAAEGADMLTTQAVHIEVPRNKLTLDKP